MLPIVKSKTKPAILSPSGMSAYLIDVTNSFYVYSISYSVNVAAVLANKTFLVNINIDKSLGNKSTKPTLIKNKDNRTIIYNLLTQSAQLKSAANAVPEYVLTYKSDITSKIPNSETSRLLLTAANIHSTGKVTSATSRAYIANNVGVLKAAGATSPLMDINLNAKSRNPIVTISPQKVKLQSMTLLYKNNIDPANVTKNTNSIVPTSKTSSGIIPKKTFTQTNVIKNNSNAMNIVASRLSTNSMDLLTNLTNQSSVVTMEKSTSSFITITEIVNIPVSQIGRNNFNIIFDLMAVNNRIHQSEKRFVNHSINLTQLLPTEPPSVKPLSGGAVGRAIFEVKQIDKYANGFFVYRRELNPNTVMRNAKYTLVEKINLLPGQSTFFEDRISTINKVLYRFIPFADEDMPATVFTSCVASFNRGSIIKKNVHDRRPIFAVISPQIDNEQIVVNISDYTPDAIDIRLLKRNLSSFEKNFSTIANINLTNNTSVGIKYKDSNVKPNHIYEYQVELIFPDGRIGKAPTNAIIEYSPVTNNIAVTKVTNLTNTSYEGMTDVTFDIEYSISETNFEFIKKLFSEQSLSTEYQEEITLNKEKLTTLFAYKVLRTNQTTGLVENFGIITDKHFSDRKFGLSRSVTDLESSNKYVYTIITYARNPETVLPKYTREVETTVEGRPSSYTLTPYKWRQPVTLIEGNIVSARALQANHSKSELEQGTVVDIKYIPINTVNILPTIETAQASKIKEDTVYIEWKVVGELEKIDHFIIKLNIHGMTTLIGTCHAISANKSFVFVDPLTNGEQGQLEYTIVPVYYDYTEGKSYKTNMVVI